MCAREAGLTLKRKMSNPAEFRYSKELLCRMNVKELGALLCCLLPLAKLGELRYMFGTESKKLVVKSDKVLIRTGGGYCTVQEHLAKYALSECLIIWRTMQQKEITFNETIMNLLELHGATQEMIA